MAETRVELKERLQSEGRWAEYVKRRAEVALEGTISLGAASKILLKKEFKSLNPSRRRKGPKRVSFRNSSIKLSDFDPEKKTGIREIVEWVFNHVDVEDVTPSMAPSPGAWSLLISVRDDPGVRADFYKSIWAKLLPTKTQIEEEDKFSDDGSDIAELIGRLQQARQVALCPSDPERN